MSKTQELWIASHPYLKNVAEFQQAVNESFAGLATAPVVMPEWKQVFQSYAEGVPLLEAAQFDLAAPGEMLLAGVGALLQHDLPEPVTASARSLQEHLQGSGEARAEAIRWVLDGDPAKPPVKAAGLLRVLGWATICRALAPALNHFAELRNEDHWMRGYCPVCGALPPMAHLSPEGGRPRMLACGYCHTSWQYRRIGCPLCGNEDQTRLPIFTIDQEPLFRLDACGECNGYLKTYTGNDGLELHLSDWSTLHLDVLAAENKLERTCAPLFQL